MFENFLSKFKEDRPIDTIVTQSVGLGVNATGFDDFFKIFSGLSFNNCLYHAHLTHEIRMWNEIVGEAFPEFSDRIFCFGYDWLGRQFTLDTGRIERGEPLVLMLEPGTGEALEIPVNFLQFHDDELVNYTNEVLASDFFKSWIDAGNVAPNGNQCIGYKKPLFLGGDDVIENLEYIDLGVYWGISSQLLNRVRELPLGTSIDNITIE